VDKYCYLIVRELPPFFPHQHYISYREIETVNTVDEIRHPSVRETLKFLNYNKGSDIRHAGDLPARAGMGTSSSFTVGLTHAISTLMGKTYKKMDLAMNSIHIEQDLIKENVGSQDQVTAAIGGFNKLSFYKSQVLNKSISNGDKLEKYLMLFFAGFPRTASEIAKEQIDNIKNNKSTLQEMYILVDEAINYIKAEDYLGFGNLLGYNWSLKKKLSKNVSTEYVDFIYNNAIKAGALSGKLLGAGNGGFMLFFVEPDKQDSVKKALSSCLYVPFKFENTGSQIIYKGNEVFDTIVDKPWGYESIISKDDNTAIWKLFLKYNEKTSSHCHPNKDTLMIVIDGSVIFTVGNETLRMSKFDSKLVKAGIYHRAEAISKNGANIIEIDSPPLLTDIVRGEDKYGRAGKSYFPEK